jgi:hypothetical protein
MTNRARRYRAFVKRRVEMSECSICGAKLRGVRDDHNAAPITDGRCCTRCNAAVVIPARCEIIRRSTREEREGWRTLGETLN